MKDILKEFDKRFYFSDGILCETIGNSGHSCNLNDIKDFISKAISQTREETIMEERLRASKIVEEMMEDSEYWQPIARRIISGDILNKLKN